jgi:hypothetical protein
MTMSNNKHTPGPWSRTFGATGKLAVRAKDGHICKMIQPVFYNGQTDRHEEEMITMYADAHLIAAAPELLEACIALVARMESVQDPGYYRTCSDVETAKKAISKARGNDNES